MPIFNPPCPAFFYSIAATKPALPYQDSTGKWVFTDSTPNGLPAIVYQKANGEIAYIPDPSNPKLLSDIVSATLVGSETDDAAITYSTGVISTGSAAPEFITVDSLSGPIAAGTRHLIYFKTRTNAADTIVVDKFNIKNSDDSTLTSITLSAVNDFILLEKQSSGNNWTVIKATDGVLNPALAILPRQGLIANKTANYTIKISESGMTFTNEGAAGTVIFTLPPALGTGRRFTFAVKTAQIVEVLTGDSDIIRIGPVKTSAPGNAQANSIGSVLEIQDVAASGAEGAAYYATSVIGNWSVN